MLDFYLKIEDINNRGEGVGRYNDIVIFVAGAVTGDIARVRLIKMHKNYMIAKLLEIDTPSSHRISPPCKYFSQCGGCQLQHIDYKAQLLLKTKRVKNILTRIAKQEVKLEDMHGMSSPFFYRNKAEFTVNDYNGNKTIGYYKRNSKNIIDIDKCLIQSKSTEYIIHIIREFINKYDTSIYNTNKRGILRRIVIKTSKHDSSIMLCLVLYHKNMPKLGALINKLKNIENIKSIILNLNSSNRENLTEKSEIVFGADHIFEYIGDLKFKISLLSFFQTNTEQAKVIYDRVLMLAQPKLSDIVIDIFCGTGTIALYMARSSHFVYGIEINSQAIKDAKENALLNNIKNIAFKVGDANTELQKLCKEGKLSPNIILLDPPRSGCSKNLLEYILKLKPQKIVYVSCDTATLARDINILSSISDYKLKVTYPIDCFPMTMHIETVSLISLDE
jgi:23S rRNA (uracil1939-C5)-methyltransferase